MPRPSWQSNRRTLGDRTVLLPLMEEHPPKSIFANGNRLLNSLPLMIGDYLSHCWSE